MYPTWAQ